MSGKAFSQIVYVPYATTLNEKGTEFLFNVEYFQTTAIVNTENQSAELADGISHNRIDFNAIGKYGLTPGLELIGGVRGRSIQSNFSYLNEDYSLSNSGLESIIAGFKFAFKEVERIMYGFEGYYRKAMHTNEEFNGGELDSIALGDDSREYGLGGNFYFRSTGGNFLDIHLLYRSPGEDLSQEIFSRSQFGLVWNYVALYAGVENVTSLGNDPYTDDVENKPIVVQGASGMFNSINRQWTAPYLGLNIALGTNWRLGFEYAQVATGSSTDLGPRFGITLAKRTSPVKSEFAKRNAKFKQYQVEGSVIKLSKSRKVAVIDKGLANGIEKGMAVDFYYFDYVGGNELIAKGKVLKAKTAKALVRIIKRYSRRRVEEGTTFRAGELAGDL